MSNLTTIQITIELRLELTDNDPDRWIFDPSELKPWPADASVRCARIVHGLCTDEARQA